jgi:16S rRNA (adenine1518-N6/adenine1519-N6)-dimethyltransferase
MKLTRPSHLKLMLAERCIVPSRIMGQNVLVDANLVRIIVDAAGIEPSAGVLEIGPGAGVLTEALLDQGAQVTAVDKDAPSTRSRGAVRRHARPALLHADALETGSGGPRGAGARTIVSNPAENPSGLRILLRLVGGPALPDLVVVTSQLDVGQRLVAGRLARLWAGLRQVRRYDVEIVRRISPTCF